jgi:DHA2 family multidrug resistance protein
MLLFFFFCFWGYKILTPDTGKPDFFWMLILRGLAMGMLFIPITMLSLSTLKGRQIGDGAAFTGMMRQLGGSFGIAVITTFMAKRLVIHQAAVASHLYANDPSLQNKITMMQQGFIAKGMDPNAALQSVYKALQYAVAKQASVLSYMDVFLYIGIMFLICIPFVLMVKGNRNKQMKAAEGMH